MKITLWRLMTAATMAMSSSLLAGLLVVPNEAAAQMSMVPSGHHAYYNQYGTRYSSGYQTGSALYGAGRYGANGYIYSGRSYGGYPYTGYRNVPYGYGSSATYGYSSPSGYGYSNGTYNSLYYRALRMRGGTYQPLYNPNTASNYHYYGVQGY